MFYGGALYGARSLVPVLKGAKAAMEAEPGLRGSLRIELAGSGPGYEEMERFASKSGLSDVVHYFGLAAAEDVGRLISRAAVTIAIQPQAPLQIPGKVFEVLHAGKPVLALMPPGCEAADILRRSGLGFIHSADDTMGIRDTLLRLWRAWQDGTAPVVPDQEYISGFSAERLPEKLAPVLSEALGTCPAGPR